VSPDPEAYRAFMLGRFHWFKRTPEGLRKGEEYFQEAIARDPRFALAYVGLADTYFGFQFFGLVSPRHFQAQERLAILKAIALDDSLAEAHTSLGHVQEAEDWEFEPAEKEYRRALDLNPNYSLAHHWLGNNLAIRGRSEEALQESRKAMALDPVSPLYRASYAHRMAFARRFDEAAAECNKALELDSNHSSVNFYLGQIEEYRGAYPSAIARFQKAYDSTGSLRYLAALGHAHAANGARAKALSIADRLRALSKTRYVSPFSFALIYLGLGDRENALIWLDKAVVNRDEEVLGFKMDPLFDQVRADARFDALCRRVGL
jgi:tetratricopeptide (TPR) repeat protein